ncbi:MAG TPA: pyruvate kinase, partial [Ferruginibacter sp.]|nr:pyruvate kinase [Ferruginibacter sp.]
MSKHIGKYLHRQMDKEAGISHSQKRTKIVATVGPASESPEQLLALARAGVNVFRLNFSHGTHANKKEIIDRIRSINKSQPYNIAILADLQGPKLRVGDLENGQIELVEGNDLTITTEKMTGTREKVYVSYPHLTKDVKVDERIFLDDGKMEVKVKKVLNEKEILVNITIGGTLLPKKGVNLPDSELTMPAMTEKDFTDLNFIIENNLDWVALSFVRRPKDIIDLKKIIKERNSKIKVIAKIEMPEALRNIRDIIVESDAVMVARGDLGVELPVEQVPIIQKEVIRKCMHRAKPVIVATQMMESMMDRTKPNRSEVTDVANAVLEGADAVMLSGETAMGEYPTLVVETMSKIIMEV